MFETSVADGVLALSRPGTRWLSTGVDGGFRGADAAYNVTVPEGWARRDVAAYAAERRKAAGFERPGPTLLTGVDVAHARGARLGPVEAHATVGLSNPAALPVDGGCSEDPDEGSPGDGRGDRDSRTGKFDDGGADAGTVNLLVGTTRALEDATLASLLATVVEAKAATLLSLTGFPGTTTDAVVVGSDPAGEAAAFAGSSTAVGGAARACVREAVRASLRARYGDEGGPDSVASAEHGVVTDRRARLLGPSGRNSRRGSDPDSGQTGPTEDHDNERK